MTQSYDWTGRIGQTWASEWQRTDRSFAQLVPHLDAAILAAAPIGPCRALDIGCGAGGTSLALAAARDDVAITGVDLSAELLAVAKTRAASYPHLTFRHADAVDAATDIAPIDLMFSRHGVMFFADPSAAFARLRAAAAPGAPLVFSCFRARADNVWAADLVEQVTGVAPPLTDGYAPGPFGFADPAVTGRILTEAGWSAAGHDRIDFSYIAGAGEDPVADAAAFFARIGPLAAVLRDAADRTALDARLKAVLERYRTDTVVAFPASSWIWRAYA